MISKQMNRLINLKTRQTPVALDRMYDDKPALN